MEKQNRPKESIYTSKKVLGRLFDQVERVDFVPFFNKVFDARIIEAYKHEENTLKEAAILKRQYDAAVRRIMAQHAIMTEFEIWSTFVMSHSKASSDYKFHEEIGHISKALKDRFRAVCYEKAGGKDFNVLGPFVAAMYKITADEIRVAVANNEAKGVAEAKLTAANMPLMSFPWLFQGVLGNIANGTLG